MSGITLDPASRRAILENLGRLTQEGLELGAWQAGRLLKKNTNADILRKPKGGRTYVLRDKAGRKRRHAASAPGETHANLSGTLRRSLNFSVSGSELEFGYFNPPPYGKWVEEGTRRMEARPSLQNNIKAAQRDIVVAIQNEIKRKLK